MSLFGLAVAPDENARERLAPGSLVTVAFLRALPNPRQHFHARLEIGFCDISQQFVTKFVGSCIDLHNYPLARRPSSTILQRRSCVEFVRVIHASCSSRCNNA